jgi:tape measure domain-containing protein
MDVHGLKFQVDGSQANQGVKTFEQAMNSAATAAENFNKRLVSAFSSLTSVSSRGFSTLSKDLSKLNGISISSALVKNLAGLSSALSTFKGPSSSSIANFVSLSKALSGLSVAPSSAKRISEISAALSGLKAPSAAAVSQIKSLLSSIANFKLSPAFTAIQASFNQMAASAARATSAINSFNASTANKSIQTLNQNVNTTANSMSRLGSVSQVTAGILSAFGIQQGVQGLNQFAQSAFNAEVSMTKFRSIMMAATGSMDGVKKGLGFVRTIVDELGVPLQQTAEKFAKFAVASKSSGLAMSEIQRVFRSASIALTATGASAADADLAFLALEQMMSKGVVSAEELRRQLSERIPGAFGMMADALGVTTSKLDKMLRMGQVLSADALPKLATVLEQRFGPGLAVALEGPLVALNRFKTAVFDALSAFNSGGFMPAITAAFNSLATSMANPAFKQFMSDMGYLASILVTTLATGMRILIDNATLLVPILTGLAIGRVAAAFQTLSSVLPIVSASFGGLRTSVAATAASTQALSFSIPSIVSSFAGLRVSMSSAVVGFTMMSASMGRLPAILSIVRMGIAGFATSIGLAVRGMIAAMGPVGAIVTGLWLLYEAFNALWPTIQRYGEELGLLSPKLQTADELQEAFNQSLSDGTLTFETAMKALNDLNAELDRHKAAVDEAIDSALYYRSIWQLWLVRHKEELDDVGESLVKLKDDYKNGAISSTQLKDALVKLNSEGKIVSATNKTLADRLIEVANNGLKTEKNIKGVVDELKNFQNNGKLSAEQSKELAKKFEAMGLSATKAAAAVEALNKATGEGGGGGGGGSGKSNNEKKVLESSGLFTSGVTWRPPSSSSFDFDPSQFKRNTDRSRASDDELNRRNAQTTQSFNNLSNETNEASSSINKWHSQLLEWSKTVRDGGTYTTFDNAKYGEEYESVVSGVGSFKFVKDFKDGFEEMRKYRDRKRKKREKEKEETDNALEDSYTNWSSTDALKEAFRNNFSALSANTDALNSGQQNLESTLGIIFNRLDLARRNVGAGYSDPSALWNAGAGSFRDINGFAKGGEFTVGGRGGTDKNFVPLRLTRGERVNITPKGEESSRGVMIGSVNISTNDYDSFRRNKGAFVRELAQAVKVATDRGRVN